MMLLDTDLSEFDIEPEHILAFNRADDNEKYLKVFRDYKLQSQQKDNTQALKEMKEMHYRTELCLIILKKVLKKLAEEKDNTKEELKEVEKLLKEVNLGRLIESEMRQSKTLILVDATGSMSNMLSKTKNTINVMFDRAQQVLIQNGFDPNLFMLQIAVYRNYSSGKDLILQHSEWESKSDKLRAFMDKTNVQGGQGNEAIEIGLWYANKQIKNAGEIPVSQVFVIGDAPPNTRDEVEKKRVHESHWKGTPYEVPTYWETEMKHLTDSGIPVYTFFIVPPRVDAGQRKRYVDILEPAFSKMTTNGGTCQELDVNNEEKGQKMLTDLFTQQILNNIGEINGGADVAQRLVQSYKTSFSA